MRWLNRHVEATAPWQLAKDEARAAELDAVLYDLVDGAARGRGRALPVPAANGAADPRGARPAASSFALERIAYGLTPETDGIAAAAPLFPRVDQPTAAA